MCNSANADLAMEQILVVIGHPFQPREEQQSIPTTTLVFRNGASMRHPVSNSNIELFLVQANRFGATIFPTAPQAGCYALEGEHLVEDGEIAVCEIYYQNKLIYKQCNSLL